MASRERPVDRGARRGKQLLAEVGREIRQRRTASGLSQRTVAEAAGYSDSQQSRIEHGHLASLAVTDLARLAAVLGLDLSLRLYPVGAPLRDAAHVALRARLIARVHRPLVCRTEVPVPIPGDLRAWDLVIVGGEGGRTGVEAETRLRDLQEFERRVELKRRDAPVDHFILLLADTRANRELARVHAAELGRWLPVSAREALAALGRGEHPPGDALVFL